MLNMPEPDWKIELELCDLFLELDERNFHCWDYRRFVVENSASKVPVEKELKFTQILIESNFSNYSSWHYRSKLLPVKYPDENDPSRIAEQKLLEELDFVQNAFFTDPEDQSAWFYHRWLLGRGKIEQNIISLQYEISSRKIVVTFRDPVKDVFCQSLSVEVDGKQAYCTWHPCITNLCYQHVWFASLNDPLVSGNCNLEVKNGDGSIYCKMIINCSDEISMSHIVSKNEFTHLLSSAKKSVLQTELDSCQQLNELEPGNKWAVLTLILLMRAIDPHKYKDEVHKYMNDLENIDEKRCSYYRDTLSAYTIEDIISSCDNFKYTNLSKMNLSRVCHLHYFSGLSTLDVSNNNLTVFPKEIAYLWNCKEISANNNKLNTTDGLESVRKLRKLDLNNNHLDTSISIQAISRCKNLKTVCLMGNKVINEGFHDLIKKFSPIEFVT